MLNEEKHSLTSVIKKNILFRDTLRKLTVNEFLSFEEKCFILSCALKFLEEYNKDRRLRSYAELAYYIILKYSIKYSDYKPLYDFATSFGFYPITKAILDNKLISNPNINDFFTNIQLDGFRKEVSDNNYYIETYEQKTIGENLINDRSIERGFIAPTSFGKSSIILDYIKSFPKKRKIAIIVPTKSLLAQTHKLIREAKLGYKILIHDEMYNDEDSFIAIFTQERALRLITRKEVIYDNLIIDEAHNILKYNSRSILIGRLLKINLKNNPSQETLYLSPLLNELKNIKVNDSQNITAHKIVFNIKMPEIFEYRIDNSVLVHNRFFVNEAYPGHKIGIYENYLKYLHTVSGTKNFIYNYRPMHIEKLAKELSDSLPNVNSPEISNLSEILKSEVHEKFLCIELLKKGVIYLHGKIPDSIKEYLEKKFSEIEAIKFVIANSVILEGINLPIDKLFIFNTFGLGGKELTNLIGRVNRLNEIFKRESNNLHKLLPEVHFINNIKYNRTEKDNMFNKIKLLRNRTFSDEILNPVLNEFDVTSMKDETDIQRKKKQNIEKIIKHEEFLISHQTNIKDKLKQYLIESGVSEFYSDIDKLAESILPKIKNTDSYSKEWNASTMIDKIYLIFIADFIEEDNFFIDYEFFRLKDPIARRYYEIIIQNRKKSLRENISLIYRYLQRRKASVKRKDHIYYIGSSYGEEKYVSEKYFNSLRNSDVAIDLLKKNDQELANYAIVKLKIEEDFISFKLNKFIVFLHDYKFISDKEYNTYIYGTTDEKKISLTKFGLNIGLISKLQTDNQLVNLELDEYNNLIANERFRAYLKTLNDFQRFEVEKFIN